MMTLKLALSILILITGVACACFYLRRSVAEPMRGRASVAGPLGAEWSRRPWRRVGAAICLLLAIMFVLGVYVVDVPDYPRAYAAYWLVMLFLVVWLCVLAVKDMLHTRRMITEWRRMRRGLGSSGAMPSATSKEPPS